MSNANQHGGGNIFDSIGRMADEVRNAVEGAHSAQPQQAGSTSTAPTNTQAASSTPIADMQPHTNDGETSGSTVPGNVGPWVMGGSGNDATGVANPDPAADAAVGSGNYDSSLSGTGSTDSGDDFVGSGGVGSAEYMDALRRGHEAEGDTSYQSDLRSAGEISDSDTSAGNSTSGAS